MAAPLKIQTPGPNRPHYLNITAGVVVCLLLLLFIFTQWGPATAPEIEL